MNYKLPSMEHQFEISVLGSESHINWTGKFNYKRPTIAERGQIEAMACRLNNDLMTIDPDIAVLHRALAHLRYTLKDFPEWWKESDMGGSLYDTNIITEIYKKCIDFEDEWREKILSGKPENVEENRPDTATTGTLTI